MNSRIARPGTNIHVFSRGKHTSSIASASSLLILLVCACRCVNADPNYGSAWFHCRQLPSDIPSTVMEHARDTLCREIRGSQRIYARGILHYIQRSLGSTAEFRSKSATSPLFLSDRSTLFTSSDFVTGLVGMNRAAYNLHGSKEARRWHLFGTDQIIT